MQTEQNKTSQKVISVIALLMLLAGIGDIVLYRKNLKLGNERNQAVLQSDSLLASKLSSDKQLASLTESIETCNKRASELEYEISSLKKEAEARNAEITKLKNSRGISSASKKQIKDLLKQNEVCNDQVKKLLAEVGQLESKIKELNDKVGSLMADKEDLKSKLDKVKALKAYEIVVTNFKNQKITQKARKTNRINFKFLIPENQAAETGSKEVHLLVINPKGQVVSPKGSKFENKTFNKEQVYSVQKTINYNNQDLTTSVDFECNCKLEKGNYKSEIYVDGLLAGKKDFILK